MPSRTILHSPSPVISSCFGTSDTLGYDEAWIGELPDSDTMHGWLAYREREGPIRLRREAAQDFGTD